MNKYGIIVIDEMYMWKVRKGHLKNLHIIGNNEEVVVNVCQSDSVRRNSHFENKIISRKEVTGKVRKLKKGKSAGIDGINDEMINNGVVCV